ncbi:2-oxoacid:ferredoxin oxidoreductase subunit beta [bacterium]|nr:MAG: 2-oxoacid:ferredoxin oxidoreductase subunit beta [bacterium]
MSKISDYYSKNLPTWCGGCGNYGIMSAVKLALVDLQIESKDLCYCFDIGCNGNMSDKIKGYRFHGLHGRVLPLATGLKLSQPNLTVLASGGDGGTYSEGINHFIHSIRHNYPITFLVHDNHDYGLTTGQCSATSPDGFKMNSSPEGQLGEVLNPLKLAMSVNATFVAQTSSSNIEQMRKVIKLGIEHQHKNNGFAFINIIQACPTYNKYGMEEFIKGNLFDVDEGNSNGIIHNPNDYQSAIDIVEKYRYPLGLIYQRM